MKRWLAGVPVVWAAVAAAGTGDGWQTDLWLGRGEVWRSRVAVEIAASGADVSEGEAVAVPVAALAGQRAEAVRVTDRSGRLLLFAPFARGTGERITAGALPGDVELLLPYTGATNGVARYWVYFDNPSAWALADFLPGETEHPVNGDFEQGDPDPVGWKRGEVTEGQRLSVETDRPFSGKRCIKAVSPETVPASWFGWKRSDFRVVPGAEVTVRVRVRGEGVKGNAGWYVHIGNAQDGQIVNQVFKAGEGSFDWREQVIRLTVPEGCTRLSTGSVLYGSGTAWYDAFSIDLGRQREKPAVKVGAVERLKIREIGRDAPWVEGRWHHRVPIRIVNLSEREEKGLLVTADLAQAVRAVRNPRFLLTLEGKEREIHRMGERLFFSCDLPPETILTYYLYVATEGKTAASGEGVESAAGSVIPSDQVLRERAGRADRETARRLVESAANLVRNPGFEEGEMGWSRNDAPAGVRYGIAEEGCMGKRCVTCSIAKEAPEGWYGWRQTVSVEAGKRYLYGGWIASRDVTSDLRIHVHLLDANHRVVDGGYLSTPGNCIGEAWQPTFGTATIPEGVVGLELHLTTNGKGTLRHDGILAAAFDEAMMGDPEQRPEEGEALSVWPVDPVVKVFRESLPDGARPFTVALARNEEEPLQVAVRSPCARSKVTVEVEPPRDPAGRRLAAVTVGWVDEVPIDFKTAYYTCKTPPYVLKRPSSSGASDGWSGFWPDPIRPGREGSLETGRTRSVWISFRTDAATVPGLYRGEVRWRSEGRLLRSDPVTVRVWDFTLPERPAFPAIYDLRVSHWWDRPGMDGTAVRRQLLAFMAEKKVCPDAVPAGITFRRDGAGTITGDFAAYDQMATYYFDTLKFPVAYMPAFFYLFGWEHPPKPVLDEKPFEGEYPYVGVDRTRLRPAYRAAYQSCLRLFWDHVKAKGWADRLVLYISDEPFLDKPHIIDQMKALCAMIHEVDPAIRIYCSTWRHQPAWNGSLDIWGVGHYGCFAVEEMKARRAAGQSIWFTTDGQMCTDTPYCAVERLLPHYAHAYQAEAYEFWGCTWLTYDPWRYGWHAYIHQVSTPGEYYYVRYPNGDGYLFYPGGPVGLDGPVTSIRLEAARDGVEDYAYLQALEALAAKEGTAAKEAAELLAAFRRLVPIPNAGGRYSSAILPEPERLGTLRERAGNLLERAK